MRNISFKNYYLVMYDITGNKLRRKIDKALKNFGVRLQYSVFLCYLHHEQFEQVKTSLRDVIRRNLAWKSPGDSVYIVKNIKPNCLETIIGTPCEIREIVII